MPIVVRTPKAPTVQVSPQGSGSLSVSALRGPEGPQGDPGLSAYEVAVENGFVGTEAEWLESLEGEQGPQGPQGIAGPTGERGLRGFTGPASPPTFAMNNALEVVEGTMRFYVEAASTIASVRASVGDSPQGSAVVIDVKKNGTSIFEGPQYQPTIEPGNFSDLVAVGNVSLSAGDYLTVNIDQVGSTFAGENLTVTINLE